MVDPVYDYKNVSPADVTLQNVKSYMRIDFNDPENDALIEQFLEIGKSFVQTYLNWRFDEVDVVPKEITIAVLAITEHWYKKRGVQGEETTKAEIPYVFAGILDQHRNWEASGLG